MFFFFFKQKTAYEMRISDWSSDVCSSDLLEWALLADGVPGDKVYSLLRTEAGVARAFAKLATIRDDIVWWEDATEPARLLEEGRVVMTSTFNAPMFNAIVVREQPFAMIWDRQDRKSTRLNSSH